MLENIPTKSMATFCVGLQVHKQGSHTVLKSAMNLGPLP